MFTSQINNILKHHPYTQRYFLGTFPSDEIPRQPQALTCFVSNTDPHYKPGQHWVAFFVNPRRQVFFFDSYGLPPITINHMGFCQRSSHGIWDYNRQQLQGATSQTCGAHCTRFLIETCRTLDPYTTLSEMTSSPTELTDRTALSYLEINQLLQRPQNPRSITTLNLPPSPPIQKRRRLQEMKKKGKKKKQKTN